MGHLITSHCVIRTCTVLFQASTVVLDFSGKVDYFWVSLYSPNHMHVRAFGSNWKAVGTSRLREPTVYTKSSVMLWSSIYAFKLSTHWCRVICQLGAMLYSAESCSATKRGLCCNTLVEWLLGQPLVDLAARMVPIVHLLWLKTMITPGSAAQTLGKVNIIPGPFRLFDIG